MGVAIRQRSGTRLFPVREAVALPQGVPGAVSSGTYFDLTTEITTLSSAWNNYLMQDTSIEGDGFAYENLTPSVISTENWPLVERVTNGIGVISMSCRGITSRFSRSFVASGGSSSVASTGFVTDTVGAASWDIMEPLLSEGGDLNLFTDGTYASYNDNCWASGFDLTGVAVWNSRTNGPRYAGVAITPRHLLYAWHYKPAVGDTVRFRKADGTLVQRTIIGQNTGGNLNALHENALVSDKCVVTLNEDLPAGIKIYPLVGEWIFTETVDSMGRPALVQAWVGVKVNQSRNVLIAGQADLAPRLFERVNGSVYGQTFSNEFITSFTDWGAYFAGYFPAFLEEYLSLYAGAVGGDSGSPAFYPLSGSDLALAGTITSQNGDGSFPNENVLNACISSSDSSAGVSTGYTVTVAPDPTA